MEEYIPPFNITPEILAKSTIISEKITKLDNFTNLNKKPYLRKQTRINSIHSSLAIEHVKDVINGKIVIGPQKEIQEVKNAYKAYEILDKIDPYSMSDLHGIMTFLMVEESGEFRKGAEGVFDGNTCIFVCPPPETVNTLMENLFNWMDKNKDILHPLILSSIFHYEFVFIHSFSDGNGRMAKYITL